MEIAYYKSPLGWIEARMDGARLLSLNFVRRRRAGTGLARKGSALFRELHGYFNGKKKRPVLRAGAVGTPFQKRVWKELRRVPYGRTVCYSDIAERIGRKKSVRAVARAIAQNPHLVLVPCHRVIGKDGSLAGFAAGVRKKRWLLTHEKAGVR